MTITLQFCVSDTNSATAALCRTPEFASRFREYLTEYVPEEHAHAVIEMLDNLRAPDPE